MPLPGGLLRTDAKIAVAIVKNAVKTNEMRLLEKF